MVDLSPRIQDDSRPLHGVKPETWILVPTVPEKAPCFFPDSEASKDVIREMTVLSRIPTGS